MKNNILKVTFAILTLGFFQPTTAVSALNHECLAKGESDFEMQNSRSGLFLVLQNQVRQNVFPSSAQRTSAFSNFIQCCYLNCQTGNTFCKEVPEGQCVRHTCH